MRSVVRVHLGPPIFRILSVFVCSRTKCTIRKLQTNNLRKITFSGNREVKRMLLDQRQDLVDGSLCKTRQSDEDSTCVHRGSFNAVLRRVRLKTNLYGGVAQLGEHLPCKQGVRSSILLISTISVDFTHLRNFFPPLAYLSTRRAKRKSLNRAKSNEII